MNGYIRTGENRDKYVEAFERIWMGAILKHINESGGKITISDKEAQDLTKDFTLRAWKNDETGLWELTPYNLLQLKNEGVIEG